MFKRALRISLTIVAMAAVTSAMAAPITVQSVLFDHDGDVTTVGPPAVDAAGNPVVNGDFVIFRVPTAADVPVGNGIDDRTSGAFDFTMDPAYGLFTDLLAQPNGTIFVATLTLILTPLDQLYTNDQFNIENTAFTGDPEIGDQLTAGGGLFNTTAVVLDLLDYYNRQQLSNFLNDGFITFTYSDDATVSGAALRITANIPEPGTLALLLVGLLPGVALARRRGRGSFAAM